MALNVAFVACTIPSILYVSINISAKYISHSHDPYLCSFMSIVFEIYAAPYI